MAGFMQAGRSARSEINIVPLIDVLLVLLIIFMVSAPLLSQRIGLDLPQAVPPALLQPPPSTPPVRLHIDAVGGVSLNGVLVPTATLSSWLEVEAALVPQPELRIAVDADADYQALAGVLAAARDAGMIRIGFVDGD